LFEIDKKARRLSQKEKDQYINEGYVTGLPVFSENAVKDLHNWYDELSSKLPNNVDINKTNMWHKASKKFHDLCRTPVILDNDAKNLVLNQEVSFDQLDQSKIVSLNLKAGQISLHNDALLHGSEANNSDRRRCGVTMRFSPTNVKGDLNVWPFFETQLARGVDEYKLNPTAKIPTGEATPKKMFSFSHEFENEW